jgi:hypothetical protein
MQAKLSVPDAGSSVGPKLKSTQLFGPLRKIQLVAKGAKLRKQKSALSFDASRINRWSSDVNLDYEISRRSASIASSS